MKHGSETCSDVLKLKHNKLAKMQVSVETKIKKSLSGEAGHGNNELCAGQATKNVLVDCSAEPVGAHWDRMIAKTRNIE